MEEQEKRRSLWLRLVRQRHLCSLVSSAALLVKQK